MVREHGLKLEGVNYETLYFLGGKGECFWLHGMGYLHFVEIYLEI